MRQWAAVSATMLARRTQTNEPGRCAVLLPVLAGLTQPLALLEVGGVRGTVPLPGRVPIPALVWPEQCHRSSRLRAAAAVVRDDPPVLRRGDLVTDLPAFAAVAPPEATLVVFHSAVLGYVPTRRRAAFTRQARDLPGHWISHEAPGVVPACRQS